MSSTANASYPNASYPNASYLNASYLNANYLVANYVITQQLGGAKYKWTTLSHNGVMFPKEYVKHDVPVIYNGQSIILNIEAEELATLYAKYIETEYVTNKIFLKNFWNDWKGYIKDDRIQSLDGVDFSLIYQHSQKQKELSKVETKTQNKLDEEKFKFATVDEKPQPVGNFRIEPPGIFMGRGCNPNLGRVKETNLSGRYYY